MEQIKACLPPSIENENDDLIMVGSNKDGAVVNDFYNMMATHEDEKKLKVVQKYGRLRFKKKLKVLHGCLDTIDSSQICRRVTKDWVTQHVSCTDACVNLPCMCLWITLKPCIYE